MEHVHKIRIIFLCGSLETGRDGVGDYTRRLAGELVRNGHQAGIIALNDQHISNLFSGAQQSEDVELPTLRLPSNLPSPKRFQQAASWITDFSPSWISLQFVPFAFHPKGLVFGMSKFLGSLGKGMRWHIMVHELWVGMDKESPRKFVYWGWLQKQLIKSLFMKLRPALLHTQSSLYMKLLQEMSFKPTHLPLFGNIPVPPEINGDVDVRRANAECKEITFVVFGGIHSGAPVTALVNELKVFSEAKGIKVLLKIIGRCGSEQLHWKKEWKSAGLTVELLGEQPEEIISKVLKSSSVGISTTPAALIEKSGSVAAMQEHGLPVLCVSRPWHPHGITEPDLPPGVVLYIEGELGTMFNGNIIPIPVKNISTITQQFVNNLLSV